VFILHFAFDLFLIQSSIFLNHIMPGQIQNGLLSEEVENESILFHIPGFLQPVYQTGNFYFPMFFKDLKSIKLFELRNGDFFSNGYPKSGKSLLKMIT